MKISILLPYKENFSPMYPGAVSLFLKDTILLSKFKKEILVYGNTNYKTKLLKNYKNLEFKKYFFKSSSNSYLNKFIEHENLIKSKLIEIHNRPNYVDTIHDKVNSKIILYFHNNPLTIAGSKLKSERISLLEKCEYIFFNSNWTKKQFFKEIDEEKFTSKFGICFQSTKKIKINIKNKKKYNNICWQT